jgi:hypothetical protein
MIGDWVNAQSGLLLIVSRGVLGAGAYSAGVQHLSPVCTAYRLRSSGASSVSCFDELVEQGRLLNSLEDAEDQPRRKR